MSYTLLKCLTRSPCFSRYWHSGDLTEALVSKLALSMWQRFSFYTFDTKAPLSLEQIANLRGDGDLKDFFATHDGILVRTPVGSAVSISEIRKRESEIISCHSNIER